MSTWSFYDPNTGAFVDGSIGCSQRNIALNTPPGLVAIEGRFDHLSQRIDNGKVVDYQPPQPSPDHEWRERVVNGRPRWVKKADVLAREAKDRVAREALRELDARSLRLLRERSTDPQIAAIEAEAAEIRKDVIRTEDESAFAERLSRT